MEKKFIGGYTKAKEKKIIKKYTPALAALVSKRTGWIIKPINESEV